MIKPAYKIQFSDYDYPWSDDEESEWAFTRKDAEAVARDLWRNFMFVRVIDTSAKKVIFEL